MLSAPDLALPPTPAVSLLLASLPLLVLSEANSVHAGHAIFKILSSIAFLSGPFISAEWSEYHRLITFGLLFSFIGDVCLIPSRTEYFDAPGVSGKETSSPASPKEETISTTFKIGVLAFAAAHICYTFAFLQNSEEVSWSVFASTFVVSIAAANWLGAIYPAPTPSRWSNFLNLSMPSDMPPLVSIYVIIISMMLAVSAATIVPTSSFQHQRFLGATMFVISDAFVAYDAFGKGNMHLGAKKVDIRRQSWVRMTMGWGLYFWGQMILAGTVYA